VAKLVSDFIVLKNTSLNSTSSLIELQSQILLPKITPGQFVNIKLKQTNNIFLRRPFSVFDVNYSTNSLSLYVKIVGKGTKILVDVKQNESLSLVYPLGNGFSVPQINDHILMVGGGSGIAPLLFLAKESGLKKENVSIIIGARTIGDLFETESFDQFGRIYFTTEDGSFGYKGKVIDHPIVNEKMSSFNRVYSCGPILMMKAVSKLARANGIFCEVSLENLMACGFGVCLCCIEPTIKGNLCVCTDGPVFNIDLLKW
jgi:dihydroorotate dehydrogenase electron transfer subunit